ncbi:hypothetical protein L3049_07990 [Labilibaculum sp. DW002]|uniref:Uncharacterized protein n=1 Tax=Paralabilibaculum antarcticum TaxID=2912572 RepID=A0ABT5VRN6_9BACT|nr:MULTISPECIES: hypothetical protein [unclassified Labilibaculum]MBI9056604.1 hypothetical protein [Labilibaculum sp.]MDE5417946.1 hypothetical protein [Labilibaculum sp. DW002]
METIDFPFNFDEMPVAAKFLLDSYSRDIADFNRSYPVFDEVFKTKLMDQIQRAKEFVSCGPEGIKIQKLRIGIYRKLESLNGMILEVQDNFPVSRIKEFDKIVEIVERKDLNSILTIIPNFVVQLEGNIPRENAETTQTIIDRILTLFQVLKLDKIELNRLLNSRGLLKEEVFRCLNHLWATMQDVMEIGQDLYKKDDPMKCVEYEANYLKMKVKTFWIHSSHDPLTIEM